MTTSAATSASTAAAGTATSKGTTTDARNKLSSDMNMFLTLLTTQLKNQDPTSPMDSDKFTEQLVQYSQVEQQISTNEKLDSLVSLNGTSQSAIAVQYIGLNAEAESDQLPLQDGAARFAYGLSAASKSTSITISDSTGKTVYSTGGETTAGVHDFKWDGKDNNGNQMTDGLYKVSATALDSTGGAVTTWTTIFGKVDGVTTQNGQTILVMGKVGVPLTDVLSVTPPTGSNSNTATDTTTGSTEDTSSTDTGA